MKMLPDDVVQIFAVLVNRCDCDRDHGPALIRYLLENKNGEYRFQGNLGFGGKLYFNNDKCYVSCYSNDESPKRLEIIRVVNEEISKILCLK